ncbi:MAG: ComEA family DNA-binding protein [Candidatus Eremiobacteraeota bacterium]|nr:ComEA family DNA-binding protein [Candidatus Eremiobacteraeota bacterium]
MSVVKSVRWQYVAVGVAIAAIIFFLPRHHSDAAIQIDAAPPQLGATREINSAPAPLASAILVYVCGAVHKPGVYRLQATSRIIDAVQRAGGANADADVEQLNLAEQVADGMKVTVPHKGQIIASSTTSFEGGSSRTLTEGTAMRRARHAHSGTGRHKLQPGQTLNVNTATEQELTTLPGVGRGLARRIIEYRSANGPFQTVDDLQNVSGVGPSKFEKMAPYIHL